MFRSRKPVEALRPWVAQVWESRRDAVEHPYELALPTGAASLTFRIDGGPIGVLRQRRWERFSYGVLWCAVAQCVVRDTSRLGGVVGVQFVPGMGAALLGVPAAEWGAGHAAFDQRDWLEPLRNAADRLACVEELLLGLRPVAVDTGIAWAVDQIVKRPEVVRIGALRGELGYSVRRLEAGFASAVGMSPKRFVRVRRFQQAVRRLAVGGEDLARLALDCGLSDQSHLNREFREFAGLTPGAYVPLHRQWVNHVRVGEKFVQDKLRGAS